MERRQSVSPPWAFSFFFSPSSLLFLFFLADGESPTMASWKKKKITLVCFNIINRRVCTSVEI